LAYTEQFPDLVRAVVFDNASDPTADPKDQAVEQWRAFQRSFDRFGAWCTAQPGCPLGNDPNVATQSYRALVSRLVAAPLALPDGRRLSYYDATSATLNLLYSEADQETLRTALTGLAAGNGQALMEQADRYHGRQPDGSYDGTDDAFTALSCMNQPVTTDHDAQREFARRINEAAPWQDDGRGPSPTLDACAFWAAPPTSAPHRPEVSDELPPLLVVAVTGSSGTPYQAGVSLSDELRARLLTVDGNQTGGVFQSLPCVDNVVGRYLIDPTVLPPAGGRCNAG
jgi:pimeloyl-ACP methyl ester carboxylesterase